MGRLFTSTEDLQKAPIAVLSYTTWKDRFGSDQHILGTKILLDREPYLVVAVMPKNFDFPLVPGRLNRTALWVPMSLTPQDMAPEAGGNWSYGMVGRLKSGVSVAQAQSDAEQVAQQVMRNYPPDLANFHIRAVVYPLQQITVLQVRPLLRVLFGAVAVVLLIGCANLAGLLLVRSLGRQQETAVRMALGAPMGMLLRQAILEGVVLSVGGGMLGIVLAALALSVGKNFLPETLPRTREIALNWWVAGFAFSLAIITGLCCGLAPALAAVRTDVNGALKEGGRSGLRGSNHARLRSTLVVGEVAVALVLLTACGLLLRSFINMTAVEIGFRPEHVVVAGYSLPAKQYTRQYQVDAFNNELLLRLRRLPGTEAAGVASILPGSDISLQSFIPDDYVFRQGTEQLAAIPSQVIGDYFAAMGMQLLRGRFFTPSDNDAGQLVVIVNHQFAEHYWPHQDPIGKRMRIGTQHQKTPWLSVVGEVADVKLTSPDSDAGEQFYQPVAQSLKDFGPLGSPNDINGNGGSVVLRSALPPQQMQNALRSVFHSLDSQLPLIRLQTMQQIVSMSEAPRRFNTEIISAFALAAVLLAMLGIYSVIAFSVASRVQEMAIRMALGSQRSGVVALVLRSGLKLAIIGCAIGIAGAFAVSGLIRSLLFATSPFDPLVMILAAAAVLLLAVVASALPAGRAAAINPVEALRGG